LVERSLGDRKLYAGKAIEDILLFEAPRLGFDYLELELPAEIVDESPPMRFRIPAGMVER
jgi:hypothetical protein